MQFLYSPDHEWNSCGVGFGADLRGVRQSGILRRAVESVTYHTPGRSGNRCADYGQRWQSDTDSASPLPAASPIAKDVLQYCHALQKTRLVGLDSCCLDLHNRHSHSFYIRPRQCRTRAQAPIYAQQAQRGRSIKPPIERALLE